jgi:hypothetical protein
MDDHLGDAIALSILTALVLALFFLFSGSPDLWDTLHEKAMRGCAR